jgi:hypothetical protein
MVTTQFKGSCAACIYDRDLTNPPYLVWARIRGDGSAQVFCLSNIFQKSSIRLVYQHARDLLGHERLPRICSDGSVFSLDSSAEKLQIALGDVPSLLTICCSICCLVLARHGCFRLVINSGEGRERGRTEPVERP